MIPPFAVAGALFRARSAWARVRNVRETVTNHGPISVLRDTLDTSPRLRASLGAVLWALAGIALLAGVVSWARWDAARDRDVWWRAEIARASSGVRHVIKERGAEAIITDRELIGGIRNHDEKLAESESALARLNAAKPAPAPESVGRSVPGRADRCSLPADCLR